MAPQPFQEGARVGGVAQAVEDIRSEGGVSQPAEAVVPVALAVDALRQRGGGGGADGASRDEQKEVERQHRALDLLLPTAQVAPVVRYEAPERLRLAQAAVDVVLVDVRRRVVGPAQDEGRPLTLAQREAGAGTSVRLLQRHAGGKRQAVAPGAGNCQAAARRDLRAG